jgi:hypothetical protein
MPPHYAPEPRGSGVRNVTNSLDLMLPDASAHGP